MTPLHYALDKALAPKRDALGRLLSEEARIAILAAERDLHAASGALAWRGLQEIAGMVGVAPEPAGDVVERIGVALRGAATTALVGPVTPVPSPPVAMVQTLDVQRIDGCDIRVLIVTLPMDAPYPNEGDEVRIVASSRNLVEPPTRRVPGRPAGQRLADDPTPEAREVLGLPARVPSTEIDHPADHFYRFADRGVPNECECGQSRADHPLGDGSTNSPTNSHEAPNA